MHLRDNIVLAHLDRLTDSTGLIQHAIYSIPRRESGYTTDDNARALRLCTRLWCQAPEEHLLSRVTTYLSFLEYARGPGRGFHNFLSYDRRWLDAEGTGDCQGQAVRALAEVLGSSLPEDYRMLARELIDAVLPTLADLRSLRAQAYVILAWGHLWAEGAKSIEPLEAVAWSAAQRLLQCYRRAQRPDWPWFESHLSYANAVLPHALFVAAQRWPQEGYLEVAEAAFAFLNRVTTGKGGRSLLCEASCGPFRQETPDPFSEAEDVFWPVGNNGWYPHGEDKTLYDQQPVEAATMADAALAAYGLLGQEHYRASFHRAHGWFHGQNSLRQPLADVRRGAGYDGLHRSGVNQNQGAESTLAYLAVELQNLELQHALGDNEQTAAASASTQDKRSPLWSAADPEGTPWPLCRALRGSNVRLVEA